MAKFILKYGDCESPHFITREVEIETPIAWNDFSNEEKNDYLRSEIEQKTIMGASGAPQVFIFLQEIT